MLFPLEFTPFESYYWCDDCPEYPTTYPIELGFLGCLRREEFCQAIKASVARHPLLSALVQARTGRIPRWIDSGGLLPSIDWGGDEPSHKDPNGDYIDLTTNVGLRASVRCAESTCRVRLQFHHACCDALGALRFVEDLLVIYHCLVDGQDCNSLLRPVDAERLKMRGDFGLSAAGYRPNLRDAWKTVRFWAPILVRKSTMLAGPTPTCQSPAPPSVSSHIVSHDLSSHEVDQIRKIAAAGQATVNDLLLRDLFLTLRSWNSERWQRAGRFRVNLPVSLRQRADRLMPAANVLGFWFLTRDSSACEDRKGLLDSIREETREVRKWRLPLYFIGGLGIAQSSPRAMRWVLRRDHSFATIVFSNTGRMLGKAPIPRQGKKLICGNVVLDRMAGVPPIRPGTRAAMVVATYGGQTSIHLNCDSKLYNTSDSRNLLNLFVTNLMRTLETGV